MPGPSIDQRIHAIERPDPALFKYYLLASLLFPPAFPFVIIPLYFKYYTMRYKFTDDGISMKWGILFRRETIVNYARIQDIHLRSNIVERWLGLARIPIQTASGNQSAELTIEGIKEFELLRDYLYTRMRGVKDKQVQTDAAPESTAAHSSDELTAVLREAVTELRALRQALEKRQTSEREESRHV
jgi:uncharacterized protein